ncbi:alcohol dehydrogenase catalytic domain-containing protein [Actinomadura parmotrematis]|uniref:alcohol dehydrogenase n=1 Tax=Actinomadura parmotrematis TaxID=2864039 RepID=A0ABS7FQP9_9ACTN|nr:alcohol dehydrogenase catalytic domain-containing protein [Actinomadura parmotrematis]MBW8482728.1 alcohol dehydrogenase catalytic domain-containing protein [Actinomadura parmotrematis]
MTLALHPPATAMVWPGPDAPHRPLAVDEVDLAPGELLVRVELATVCGSDLHTVSGRRPGPAPGVLGHEAVGTVARTGGGPARLDVRGRPVRTGDRVAVGIYAACGRCARCRRGLPQKCERLFKYGHAPLADAGPLSGGYATHLRVRKGTPLAAVDPALPAALAAPLGCATATAVAAVAAAGDTDRSDVTVCGAGLLGLLATAMLAGRGATVTVLDPDPRRRATALRMGAARALDAAAEPPRADAYLELSGAPAAARRAVARTVTGGTIVLAGTVSPGAPLDWEAEDVVRGLLTVRGVHNYAPEHLAEAVAWTERNAARLPVADLLGTVHPLSRLDDALAEAARGDAVRIAVDPTR